MTSKNSLLKSVLSFLTIFLLLTGHRSVLAAEKLVFADLNWNSAQVHNRIAGFILKHGYGYEVGFMPHTTVSGIIAVTRGTVDINMEIWVELQHEAYAKALVAGKILDLGQNYSDAWQGWIVPTYVIKGDPQRDIQARAPGLKSVDDLPRYWEVFKDPDDPTKGRYINGIPGTEYGIIGERKIDAYGLRKYYNVFGHPQWGADYGLVDAYQKGRPWFGYYWTPSWVMGKFKMTVIEEPPFDEALWADNLACSYPPTHVNIVVAVSLLERAPEVVKFLKNYKTDIEINNNFLAQMDDNMGYADDEKININKAAIWFLKNHESLWATWIPEDAAVKVKAALK
jgi:glycine betaine/proline transport system substrate-binding protein